MIHACVVYMFGMLLLIYKFGTIKINKYFIFTDDKELHLLRPEGFHFLIMWNGLNEYIYNREELEALGIGKKEQYHE